MTAAQLDTALRASGIPITGISIGRKDDRSTWRVDFAPEATDEQKARATQIVAAFDLERSEHNDGIDAQVLGVEEQNPFKHRAMREGLYALPVLADLMNAVLAQLEAEIRTIPGHETFTLQRLPDLKKNSGMKRIKAADDAIRALLAQKLP